MTEFSHAVLEEQIKQIITSAPMGSEQNAPLKCSSRCKTFVIATRLRGLGCAVRLRSYDTHKADAFPARIWEAARATTAASTFFRPIKVYDTTFGDGGCAWSNPCEEAIAEARSIWPNRHIGCLVSLGCGKEGAIGSASNEDPSSLSRMLFTRFAPRPSFRLEVADYCLRAAISCEKTHRKIEEHPQTYIPLGNYFRFNAAQEIQIGFEEWKRHDDFILQIQDYMNRDGDISNKKRLVARLLVNPNLSS